MDSTLFSYIAEEEIPDHLKCEACLNPLYEPHRTNCSHVFCFTCIPKKCTECNISIKKDKCTPLEDLMILKELEDLQIRCETCDQSFSRHELTGHKEFDCPGSPVSNKHVSDTSFTMVKSCAKKWYENQQALIPRLDELADHLDGHYRNVKIAQVSGTSASLLGTALAIGGVIAAPFTFGISLGLSIAGGAVSVAGATTCAGASIAMWSIKKKEIKKVQKAIEDDIRLRNKMVKLIARSFANISSCPYMNKTVFDIPDTQNSHQKYGVTLYALLKSLEDESYVATVEDKDAMKGSPTGMEIVTTAGNILGVTSTTGAQVGRVFITNLGAVSHLVSVAGVALSVITVPIDVYTLARDSAHLHKGTVSEISAKIRELSKELSGCSLKLYQKYDPYEVEERAKQNEIAAKLLSDNNKKDLIVSSEKDAEDIGLIDEASDCTESAQLSPDAEDIGLIDESSDCTESIQLPPQA